jgi:histidyl-tRNA synthetase
MVGPLATDDIDDAAPLEAVKWSFVRRRVGSLFLAHGYREVSPPPLELRGTHLLARRPSAWPVGDDLELRADPIISLAQLYARARRDMVGSAPLVRWLLSDVVFDPDADGPHRYHAWHAIAGALFGVEGFGPELEAVLLAQRIAVDLALTKPSLRISFGDLPPPRAKTLRAALAELEIRFVEQPGAELAIALLAQPSEGEPIVVLRARRHDGLLAALGEPPAPMFGVVMSVRRAASCAPGGAETYEPAAEVYFLVADEDARLRALAAAVRERARGMRVEVELRAMPREAQLARAATLRARAIVEFGSEAERVHLRLAGEQDARDVPLADLSSALRRLLR